MPLPIPRPEESKEDFIERFMGDAKMIAEFPNERQRYAVATETWRDKN
jgi:hypothetical protein